MVQPNSVFGDRLASQESAAAGNGLAASYWRATQQGAWPSPSGNSPASNAFVDWAESELSARLPNDEAGSSDMAGPDARALRAPPAPRRWSSWRSSVIGSQPVGTKSRCPPKGTRPRSWPHFAPITPPARSRRRGISARTRRACRSGCRRHLLMRRPLRRPCRFITVIL